MSRRRHVSDSDEDDDFSYARKKRRISDVIDIENRLQSLILRVGEKSTASLESNLEGLAAVLDADLPNYKPKIMRILAECVVNMPEKLTIYSTLIGLLNLKNYSFGEEFIELLVRNLRELLKNQKFEDSRSIVLFLSDLVNCRVILPGSLICMYENFVEVTLEDGIPQVRSDWYVYSVISSLPWVGKMLSDSKDMELTQILKMIDSYIGKRQHVHVTALRVWSSDRPHPQEEYLDCLWSQIKQLRSNKWVEKQIVRPYTAFDQLHDAMPHALPQINPPMHHEDMQYPLPRVVFRLFDYTDVPEGPVLPGVHSIERYLIEELLHKIIVSNHEERKDCAVALLEAPSLTTFPINYMTVEVIFSHLFHLPRPPYLEIFYGSLFIELCKLQPTSMPQVLAQSIELLYNRLDHMKAICIERFCTWFAYHLSNFQFTWSWQDWSEVLSMDILMPKPVFVQGVLAKCLRLSYHQRLVDTCPENFSHLLPDKPEPYNKYLHDEENSLVGTQVAVELTQLIKQKCKAEDTLEVLRKLPQPISIENENAANQQMIDVLVTTLLNLGSKSFSHTFAAVAKYHAILKGLCDNEDNQIFLLNTMYEVWRTHKQMMCVLVDKLLKTQIVTCAAVANWLFSVEMSADFTRMYVWEIMHSVIRIMNKQVDKLQTEVSDARDRLQLSRRMNDELIGEDVPTEEMIERMDEKLEAACAQQKNLFLIIFQRFIIILSNHLGKCETEGIDYNTTWYKWVIDSLQHIFLQHHELIDKHISTLETLLFTSDIDFHILELFQQFCALRS